MYFLSGYALSVYFRLCVILSIYVPSGCLHVYVWVIFMICICPVTVTYMSIQNLGLIFVVLAVVNIKHCVYHINVSDLRTSVLGCPGPLFSLFSFPLLIFLYFVHCKLDSPLWTS